MTRRMDPDGPSRVAVSAPSLISRRTVRVELAHNFATSSIE